MIFDEDYDTALWYMVRANRRKGKEIVEFLKELPEEFIYNVRKTLAELKGKDSDETVSTITYSKIEPGIYYSFDYTSFDEGITLSKCKDDGRLSEDLFELMLFPIKKEEIEKLEFSDEEWIGTVSNVINTKYIGDKAQLIDVKESEYCFHHFPIGYFVSHSHEILNGEREVVLFRPVSINRAPKDITRDNLLKRRLIKRN